MALFLQWNCRGLRANWEELRRLVARFCPSCVCLQEVMLGGSSLPPLPGYVGVSSPPPPPGVGSHGGVALYARRDLPVVVYSLNTPLQAVAVRLHLDRLYTVASVYLPPSADFSPEHFRGLVRQLPGPFLLLGDLNGRHPLWGDATITPRGRLLASLVDELELGVLNSGSPTHFHVQTASFSVLDLALCSPEVLADLEWDVVDDLFGSDHFPTLVSSPECPVRPSVPRWRLDRADWSRFRDLTDSLAPVEEQDSAEAAVEYFSSVVLTSGLASIPRSSGFPRRRPVPWWSADCEAAVREKRQAYTRYRRRPCENLLVDFRRARARFRYVQKRARRAPTFLQCRVGRLSWRSENVTKRCGSSLPPSPSPFSR